MIRLIFSVLFSMWFGGMIIGMTSGAKEGLGVGLGVMVAMMLKSIHGYRKRKRAAEERAIYNAGCPICGGPFQKTVYTVEVDGEMKRVCGFCGNRILRNNSKKAVDRLTKDG